MRAHSTASKAPSRTMSLFLMGSLMAAGLGVSALLMTEGVRASDIHAASGKSAALALSDAFARVAADVSPSVITVQATKVIHTAAQAQGPDFRSPFDQLLPPELRERFFGPGPSNRPNDRSQQGQGTGFVVDGKGILLTNHHVIDGAEDIRVILQDGRSLAAKVLGSDPATDIAVLKVEALGLAPLPLGDSSLIRVGDWVVAAGNPFGLTCSITTGIVSAKGRSRVGIVDYEDFIQTDAAINPGNSGGPLLDLDGRVIGINTAIASSSGGSNGVGFAIPINLATRIMDRILRDGMVSRGYLGVMIQDVDQDLGKTFNYPGSQGAVVSEVKEGTPAAQAGLQEGDIVTGLDGTNVKDANELRNTVAMTDPGTMVNLDVFRAGSNTTVKVKLGTLPTTTSQTAASAEQNDLGMGLQNLTGDMAGRLGLAVGQGVLVTSLDPRGLAAHSGIRVNDVIESVQGHGVATIQELQAALAKQDLERGVRLGIRTGEHKHFLVLKNSAAERSRG